MVWSAVVQFSPSIAHATQRSSTTLGSILSPSSSPLVPLYQPANPTKSIPSTDKSRGSVNVSIVETLKKDIASKRLELQQLELALGIIQKLDYANTNEEDNERAANDYDESHPEVTAAPPSLPQVANPVPPTTSPGSVSTIPIPPRFKMACSACEDEMYRAYKRVPSGMTVEYWQCSNGQCNNEMY
jgi:hypothetical protein